MAIIPTPEAGLVLSYAYLWHHEQLSGQEEGRKDRPVVVILAAPREGDQVLEVSVLPITHRPPDHPDWAIEIPRPVKLHLGLDDARSWIIVVEGNEFLWPGYDLRKIAGSDRYDYGFMPPRFFAKVAEAFERFYRAGKVRLAGRE